ncbi:hypothetical protein M406DRAFT_63095 [Cryphonectria parasitica EP155]|uniref:N-acetyltransferase domain-containing protein n=1 Tax=Cryphonectria parasitica (strain ATCC 38755 / EP155) TaxID=660469 RepID=A0A9P4Y9X6_CRYP1|nr:uncharacterized protein M406DRAFT_63095 [Cryphonectria parasitica EP155]KAF3769150.1 hypothetical protein M406DRAFT_63095 [Cryphonectria parasitica EP155]
MPWFNYRVKLPIKPLPSIAERPHIKTDRLIVRPIMPEDLETFHALRSEQETQYYSPTRGRADRDIEETRKFIENLQAPHDIRHWYFGGFLSSTGEMIGEAGFLDCVDLPRCGWPEGEICVKKKYWRQGYGTELMDAVLNSWWDLPRAERRHQLIPVIFGDNVEPGAKVVENVAFTWEASNEAATKFIAKIFDQTPVAVDGFYELICMSQDWERRDGREGGLVRWAATLVVNPRQI